MKRIHFSGRPGAGAACRGPAVVKSLEASPALARVTCRACLAWARRHAEWLAKRTPPPPASAPERPRSAIA